MTEVRLPYQTPREQAANWAQAILSCPPEDVFILDTETANLHGEIIELAMINLAGEVVYDGRFCPVGEIHPGAYAVHGISKADLEGEPSWAQVFPLLARLVSQAKHILIYNASYDTGVWDGTNRVHGLSYSPLRNTQCLMTWYAKFRGHKVKLPGADHGALADCRAALAVLQEMAAEAAQRPAKEEVSMKDHYMTVKKFVEAEMRMRRQVFRHQPGKQEAKVKECLDALAALEQLRSQAQAPQLSLLEGV